MALVRGLEFYNQVATGFENERAAETTTIFLSFQDLGASWRRVSSAGTVLYEAIFLPAMASLSLVLPLQIYPTIGEPMISN